MPNKLIHIIDDDVAAREDLAEQIRHYGYETEIFGNNKEAVENGCDQIPAVIIRNIKFDGEAPFSTVETDCNNGKTKPALLYLAEEDDIRLRLRGVRFGGNAFFPKPVNMDQMIGKLDELTSSKKERPPSILIADHDPEFALKLSWILTEAGMAASVTTNPTLIMESIIEYNSDLLLMNLYFPEVLGMEMASILRQQPAFESIPIVFYSGDTDTNRQIAALSRGGDGYLPMPIEPEHLIASVTSRVQRSRMLRAMIIRDRLTGLLNHTRTREMLGRELKRYERRNKSLGFALLDIDRFKNINDTYGHEAGDRVIKSLSRLLKQRIWSKDIIGRYGGEEFAIIIKSHDLMTVSRILNEIRIDFSHVRHESESGPFYATLSGGIAGCPPHRSIVSIVDAATRANQTIKNMGGNRIALMRPPSDDEHKPR